MRFRALLASALLTASAIAAEPQQPSADQAKQSATHHNPVISGLYADPDILWSEKTRRFYLYPTSDGFREWTGTFFKAFSSPDLVEWKDEGVILDLPKDVPWGTRHAWAPCIIETKTPAGYRYYYYFTAAKKIGVAVADSPVGPFKDSGKPLIDTRPSGVTRGQQIDPAVFRDPNTGKHYLYWGNAYLAVAELNDDMVSLKPDTLKLLTPDKTYGEGSTLFYRQGKYYLLWSENDTRSPDYRVRYATATSPLGPFIAPKDNLVIEKDPVLGIYGTGHNSVIQIPGRDEWYIVYHRFNYPKGITMGRDAGYNREVCIDRMNFDVDGNILPVHPTHEGIAPVSLFTAISFAPGTNVPTAAAPAADPLSWSNPLVPQRADPHVSFHSDGYYYFTATVPNYDCIELRRARSIGGLSTAKPKVIWRKHDSGPMSASIWAPELHFIDGKWYLYFSAGDAHKNWASIRPYILEGEGANPLEAHWTEKGRLKLGWESFSLDGTTFTHRGVRYFVWAQIEAGVKGSNIYISRMDTPCSITGPIICLSRPDREWERRDHWVNEGPSVLVKNGHVWISYSASATDANYCLGLLSASGDTDLLRADSWTKSPEPVFRSDAAAGQFGPGHNSFTTTPDGKTDILVYHSRNYEKIQGDPLKNNDRATRAQVIRWRADGTPDFGTPVSDGAYRP